MKFGDIVQSHYRARWYGIVLRSTKRKDIGDLVTVLITHDNCGRKQREKKTQIDEAWLTLIKQEDAKRLGVLPDWAEND